jgi:hypothetical protein
MALKQSTTRNVMFMMIDSADHFSKKTGLTVTVNISKDGGSFAAAGGTVSEVANGWYKVALNTTDTNTLGDLAFHCTATGADDTDFRLEVVVELPLTGNSIADAILGRDLSAVTESGMAKLSLYTLIMKAIGKAVVDLTTGILSIYRSDSTTVHATQTLTPDSSAQPVKAQTKVT